MAYADKWKKSPVHNRDQYDIKRAVKLLDFSDRMKK